MPNFVKIFRNVEINGSEVMSTVERLIYMVHSRSFETALVEAVLIVLDNCRSNVSLLQLS